eukprot:GSChrysophyteH1.ASY1.ANO1.2507.1 assembled CDS
MLTFITIILGNSQNFIKYFTTHYYNKEKNSEASCVNASRETNP